MCSANGTSGSDQEKDPELEGLRELMREQAAIYDALRARLNFLEHDLLNSRKQRAHLRQPQHSHRHHLHVDHQAEAQACRLLQAARGSYQSYGHASYDTYTYGYGGGEDDYDSGEALEACSGDIIVHNHYYDSCGCDEPEYDGGGDAESEYDLAPGEDPEFEGPTEEEYYYELDWLADYEVERAEYEDEHERD